MLVDISPAQICYLEYLVKHKVDSPEPDFISQNKAHKRFGRSNVERWVTAGIVKRYYRPTVVEYKLKELLSAAENQQDYLIR